MLTLPIKKKWFDMILSGEKKEEYREIKPYWENRLPVNFGYFYVNGKLQTAYRFDAGLQKSVEAEHETEIVISFKDNGVGLDPSITNIDALFDMGVTTTKVQGGNGIGLNHVKLLVEDTNGNVAINEHCDKGFEIIVRIKR